MYALDEVPTKFSTLCRLAITDMITRRKQNVAIATPTWLKPPVRYTRQGNECAAGIAMATHDGWGCAFYALDELRQNRIKMAVSFFYCNKSKAAAHIIARLNGNKPLDHIRVRKWDAKKPNTFYYDIWKFARELESIGE